MAGQITSGAVDEGLQRKLKRQNTPLTSFAADNVFSNGTTYQMAVLTGDAASGYPATLIAGIAA